MVYLSPMTTSTSSSDFPSPSCVCADCGHEHDIADVMILDAEGYLRSVDAISEIQPGEIVLCVVHALALALAGAAVMTCERRKARQPQPDDELPGIDPEERSLSTAHLEEQNSSRYEDRHGSWADYDGPDDDGWDD